MKVKIISYSYITGLEERINEFIKNKEVVNISFSDATSGDLLGTYTALILYREE